MKETMPTATSSYKILYRGWWSGWGLNPRPPARQTSALLTDLGQRCGYFIPSLHHGSILQVLKLLQATRKGKKSKRRFEVTLGNRPLNLSHHRPPNLRLRVWNVNLLSHKRVGVALQATVQRWGQTSTNGHLSTAATF